MTSDEDDRFPPVQRRAPSELRFEKPEPPPPLGGSLDAVEHSPSRLDRVPRAVKRIAAGVVVFLAATGALWLVTLIGWRYCLAFAGCALVLAGLLVLRVVRPSQEFLDGVRKEQVRVGLPVTEKEELRSGQTGIRALAAAICIGLGLLAVAAAIWG